MLPILRIMAAFLEWILICADICYAFPRYDCLRGAGYHSFPSRTNSQDKVQETVKKENSDHSEGETSEMELPADIRGLLHWSSPLLRSQNSAVVMAVAGIYWVFAPNKDLKHIVKPLLFLLRSSYDSQYVVR